MKFKNLLKVGLTLSALLAVGLSVSGFKAKDNKAEPAEATYDDYVTYRNDDVGFVSRNASDSAVVIGDADGGMQTKGVVVGQKSELRLRFKVRGTNTFWIGVGGVAIYYSKMNFRATYLTRNASSAYSRNSEIDGMVLKTEDGSTALSSSVTSLQDIYANYTVRIDLTNRSAAKLDFVLNYNSVDYYLWKDSTIYKTITFTHAPINFASDDYYCVMAGVNATNSGVDIFKFEQNRKDLSKVMSRGGRTFSYDAIGEFLYTITLSERINAVSEYLNDHSSSFCDENGNRTYLENYLYINGKPLSYWISYDASATTIDKNSPHGIYNFPMYTGGKFSPVSVRIGSGSIEMRFNTAIIPVDSLVITFKASGFKTYYNGFEFRFESDFTYYGTLKTGDYGTVGSQITFETTRSSQGTKGEYTIIEQNDWGEKTAAGGAKYRKFALYTNMPRSTNISSSFPHDHYRYMFDNVLFNGKSLTYYNVWGRGNNKDFTDLTTPTPNTDYELEHPGGNTGINYNMVTYLQIATDQENYVFIVEIPNKLMEDFRYSTYNFELKDGSAWHSTSGVVRVNYLPDDGYAVQNFVDDNLHMSDYTTELGYCSDSEHHYYLTAKIAYNKLTSDQHDAFGAPSFADAKARYEAWGVACHDANPYDGTDEIHSRMISIFNFIDEDKVLPIAIVLLAAIIAITGISVYANKRRKNY